MARPRKSPIDAPATPRAREAALRGAASERGTAC